MRSNYLTLAALTLGSLFVTVRADNWWYAIFDDYTGTDFLHSKGKDLETKFYTSVDSAQADKGQKGLRWMFRAGPNKDGYITTQAHKSEIVGYDSSENEFHVDFDTGNVGSAVVAHWLNDTHITLCFDRNCIGRGAQRVDGPYTWHIQQIEEAK